MKFGLFALLVFFAFNFSSCNSSNSTKEKEDSKAKQNVLMVYSFHGTRQCSTCKHMKAYTKATLEKYFKKEMQSGDLIYRVVDVDDESNYDLAEKFEATGTALMADKIVAGKDHILDWSNFAFEYANGDQATYEKELKKLVDKQLK